MEEREGVVGPHQYRRPACRPRRRLVPRRQRLREREGERRRRAAVARRSRPSPSRSPLVAAPGGVLPALSASGEVGLLERSGGREREGKSREFFLMYTVYNRGFILERRLRNPTVEKIWRDVATLAARGAPAECICKMPCLDFFLHLDIIVLSLYLIIISLL
jgi:hypothetical protein